MSATHQHALTPSVAAQHAPSVGMLQPLVAALALQQLADATANATATQSHELFAMAHTGTASSARAEWLAHHSFTRAFGESFFIILATEIGDRTFFIAAVMAMRASPLVIWCGAAGALFVMTILSTLVGHVAPLLIPRVYTQYFVAALFAFFGVRMLWDGWHAGAGASEELEEVEAEMTAKKHDDPQVEDLEDGSKSAMAVLKTLGQAFTLTFLAEWGDRSQIATIALAAAREPFGVTCGACLGHALCTGIAVIGGKLLASSISERTVLLVGGVLFCIFAVLALFGVTE